ncbi:MAG: RNase adapter RapZ [Candidatus Limnocylindria bacterium]
MPADAAMKAPGRASARSRGTRRGGAADRVASRPTTTRPETDEQLVIITGLSGAGKSQASKLFEDIGYYCVDNLPPELLEGFLEVRRRAPDRYRKTALVLDIRAGDPAPAIERAAAELRDENLAAPVIYLEAADATLVARFSETRHRHPVASDGGVLASIAEERRMLEPTRALAQAVVDTSGLSIAQLRERLIAIVGDALRPAQLTIELVTFGFKFGIPLDADLMFDVRFLTNPHYVADLRSRSGLERQVRDYVMAQPAAGRFLRLVEQIVDLTSAAYVAEGKSRLTVALGCTGGYHRSIVLAEELAGRLERQGHGPVSVFHRELTPR